MKSARINFGQPNTEYKLDINEAGEATSCYNQDTDTEYIGGGGGGGDFSTAEVTLICEAPDDEQRNVNIAIAIEASPPFEPVSTTGSYITLYNGDEFTRTAILYKGHCKAHFSDANGISGTGNVEITDLNAMITGDCTITIS